MYACSIAIAQVTHGMNDESNALLVKFAKEGKADEIRYEYNWMCTS